MFPVSTSFSRMLEGGQGTQELRLFTYSRGTCSSHKFTIYSLFPTHVQYIKGKIRSDYSTSTYTEINSGHHDNSIINNFHPV